MESKKKNITSRDMEAPSGRHMACKESRVWMPLPPPDDEEAVEEADDEAESLQSFSSLSPEIRKSRI